MARQPALTLTQTRIANGWWEGVLSGARLAESLVEAWHQDRQIAGVEIEPLAGKSEQFAVRVPIPPQVLNEGVQTVVLRIKDRTLASFSLIAGQPLDEDLRAEITLLRAELDLLKAAFRRHCAETSG